MVDLLYKCKFNVNAIFKNCKLPTKKCRLSPAPGFHRNTCLLTLPFILNRSLADSSRYGSRHSQVFGYF